ncbi:hypothetical protein [Janthinobacterium sp. BJB426]|uniref:hypothetical protein n=1 Tax=Janthinobacterium sp. BJB426 TaxID=2048010 RepID=UPI001F163499|nr:hypothetical protein [Janthinobacterium sp. BJB426]
MKAKVRFGAEADATVFCLFCGVGCCFLHSLALLEVMSFDAISARVDNDGANMAKRMKIVHQDDRRDCRIYPSGLVIDEVALHSLVPVAPHIYL